MRFPKFFSSKKGITPIISVILLLMMTIAIAGLAYTFLQRMQGTIQTSSENTSLELLGGLNVQLKVEGFVANCSASTDKVNITIYIRNAGTEQAEKLQLFVDDALQSGMANDTLAAGTVTSYSGGVLDDVSCSEWVNKTKEVRISSRETSAEKLIKFTCTYSSYLC
ncbi:TPA: hypothetical protein H1011_00300 [archaeon]|jgi:flagellin-like protein|uniref:Uncharacterized protein n=1 Tax=Candidatus Undinarchaeum marinum TaxID=2756141 RepID=A0A832V031_9ARCH|nr:hypothetical protein [Candidatus Undinarchaeum marinum]